MISIVFGMFLAMFYSIGMIVESGIGVLKSVFLDQYGTMHIVSIDEYALLNASSDTGARSDANVKLEEIRAELSRTLNSEAICCDTMNFDIGTVLGAFSFEIAFLTQKGEVQTFLDHQQVEISEGVMPENANELLIGETYAKNINKGIGDTISFRKSINYRIVGILQDQSRKGGKRDACYLIVGTKSDDTFPGAIVLFPNDATYDGAGHREAINYHDVLSKYPNTAQYIDSRQIEYVVDYTTWEKQYTIQYNAITNAMNKIRIISSTAIFICLIVIFNLYMNDRRSEWCLYHSIGYSSKEIYFLIIRELLIILSFAVLVGFVGYLGIYEVINKLLFEPLGVTPVLFIGEETLGCFSILTLFFGILQTSVFYALQRIKTVDAIDDSFI